MEISIHGDISARSLASEATPTRRDAFDSQEIFLAKQHRFPSYDSSYYSLGFANTRAHSALDSLNRSDTIR